MRAISFILVCAFFVGMYCPVLATPLPVKGIKGPVKWKKGAVINVYIPLDPKRNDPMTPRNRHNQLKDAVDDWKPAAAEADVTINSVVLDGNGNVSGTSSPPDAGAEGSVTVSWEQNNSSERGSATPSTTEDGSGHRRHAQ